MNETAEFWGVYPVCKFLYAGTRVELARGKKRGAEVPFGETSTSLGALCDNLSWIAPEFATLDGGLESLDARKAYLTDSIAEIWAFLLASGLKIERFADKNFSAPDSFFRLAARAGSEQKYASYLEQAEFLFARTIAETTGERRLVAYVGAACAQFAQGELTNGLETLAKSASVSFDETASDADRDRFLTLKIAARETFAAFLGADGLARTLSKLRADAFAKLETCVEPTDAAPFVGLLCAVNRAARRDYRGSRELLLVVARSDSPSRGEAKQAYFRIFGEKSTTERSAATLPSVAKSASSVESAAISQPVARSTAKKASSWEDASAGEGRYFRVGDVAFHFRYCPPGTFSMGGDRSEEEKPKHKVALTRGFWTAQTPTTQRQWTSVGLPNPSRWKGNELPVETISWDDCAKFVDKLNQSGSVPKGWKAALPTEAQWEYACRAGTTGDFPSGDLKESGRYKENSGGKTRKVGQKKANPWGLFDALGNVCEWTSDWKGDYESKTATDPTGPKNGLNRVVRGGYFATGVKFCRSASRSSNRPSGGYCYCGFRLVLVPEE